MGSIVAGHWEHDKLIPNQTAVENIKYVKSLYDLQVEKIKKEEYIKDLLYKDYLRAVKEYISRYDMFDNFFVEAQNELSNKKLRKREHLDVLKSFWMEDFLNNDENFKVVNICRCGLEGYAWWIVFEGYGETFRISVPIKKNLTIKNLGDTNGMFKVAVKDKDNNVCWFTLAKSYEIKPIADSIKEHFKLDKSENCE